MPTTRSTTRRAAADAADTVLALLLQHARPSQRLACSLLPTSASTAQRVLERWAGALHVSARPASADSALSFALWLQRNGALLRELTFEPRLDADDDESVPSNYAAGCLVAEALHLAPEEGGSLQHLRAVTCGTHNAAPTQLLLALPEGVTRLGLTVSDAERNKDWSVFTTDDDGEDASEATLDELVGGLARLCDLRDLRLHTRLIDLNAVYLTPALRCLTRLTSLSITGAYFAEADAVHPELVEALAAAPGLQRLAADMYSNGGDFSSLTSLTELDLGRRSNRGSVSVEEGLELPPNLLKLHGGIDAGAARGVPRLRHISLPMPAPTLVQLGAALTGLTHVALQHTCKGDDGGDGGLAAAVATLAPLPVCAAVRHVELCGRVYSSYEPAPVLCGPGLVEALAGLSSVSHLTLSHELSLSDAALERLPAVLAGLPALRALSVSGVLGSGQAAAPGMLAGVAGLSQLRVLSLASVPLGGDGALLAALEAGTQLTRLELAECGVTGAGVCATLAPRLAGLRELVVQGAAFVRRRTGSGEWVPSGEQEDEEGG